MNDQQPWTIKRLLDWTSDYFSQHQTENARLDAEVLLAEALGCQRIELYTRFDQEPLPEQKDRFREWVKRHADGEPVAYLVGHREFYSIKFNVDHSVLIPRPETEHLVSETIELSKSYAVEDPSLIDIGTGSGAISVALAKHLPGFSITATDISPAAIDVARSNIEAHQLESRIELVESDLFESIEENRTFDFVVSNPPYIGNDEQDTVDVCVRDYEPDVALFTPDGNALSVIERLVNEAGKRLVPGGWLLFEMSPAISSRCLELVEGHPRFHNVRIVKDLARLDRVLIAQCR